MTPINYIFMLVAISPLPLVRFGFAPLGVLIPVLLVLVLKAKQYYEKIADEKNILFVEALEEDLPDMSPVHFFFFGLIAFPVLYYAAGGNDKAFIGLAMLWLIYAIYYYGFRRKRQRA